MLTPIFFDIQILIPRASAFMALAFCRAASASILAQLPRCTSQVRLPFLVLLTFSMVQME